MRAEVTYLNGWRLTFPKEGLAPMLFLEWLSNFRAGRNWLHKVNKNGDKLTVILNMPETQYHACADYINANLPTP